MDRPVLLAPVSKIGFSLSIKYVIVCGVFMRLLINRIPPHVHGGGFWPVIKCENFLFTFSFDLVIYSSSLLSQGRRGQTKPGKCPFFHTCTFKDREVRKVCVFE